jgi:hypothetical protein
MSRPSLGYGVVTVRAGLEGVPVPMNPKVVEVPAASEPLYEALRTVTVEPLVLSMPFQSWLID